MTIKEDIAMMKPAHTGPETVSTRQTLVVGPGAAGAGGKFGARARTPLRSSLQRSRWTGSVLLNTLTAVLAAMSVLTEAVAADQIGTVYYQVTSADGSVRDLNEPPRSRQGIRRVLRISRFEPALKGYEILTTEAPTAGLSRRGRTVKRDLIWNGKAWVGPEKVEPAKPVPARIAVDEETRKTKLILKALHKRLKERDHEVAKAEEDLAKAKGTDYEAAVKQNLESARRARKKLSQTIDQYNRQLEALEEAAKPGQIMPPSGQVEHLQHPPAKSDLGIAKPVTQRAVLPHRVNVWKLPPGKGERSYTVLMAHPEAGRFGSFHYVAYADTDGDGLPDKLIARSPLAVADAPGEWTRWTFTTAEPAAFIGSARVDPGASVYCHKAPPQPDNWRGLQGEVYVAPFLGVTPKRRWSRWPYLTNIRINVNQNPDAMAPAEDSKLILR